MSVEMDNERHSEEVLDRNEEHVTGLWRKGYLCQQLGRGLAELCSCSRVLQKVEFATGEIGYLAEKTSKQRSKGVV